VSTYESGLYQAVGMAVQFALGLTGFALLLRLLAVRRPRWRVSRGGLRRWCPPSWWLSAMGCRKTSLALRERDSLLAGCGLRIPADVYLASRRSALLLMPAVAVAVYFLGRAGTIPESRSLYAVLALIVLFLLALYDKSALEAFKRYRADRIRREIVVIGSQLLYYAGSRLHLHGKLMRCLPYARLMKGEMQLLLNEWYHDPDAAIARFGERLGTGESRGFAETIRSLRLSESDEVYDMLREVAKEYKAKIELAKAGRKETVSYVLFVLAGLPIMYTFQIFLHPWIQESRKLFDVLNS